MIAAIKSLIHLRLCAQLAIMSYFSQTSKRKKKDYLKSAKQTLATPTNFHQILVTSNAAQLTKSPPNLPQVSNKLSDVAQKAICASLIIEQIRNSKSPTSMSQSLRDQVIGITIDLKEYGIDIDDKNKIEVLQMFITGIQVDRQVFDQGRVLYAQTNQKIIFFPTNNVSKLVFNYLMKSQGYVITGSLGIGKTFSYIMFMYLAKYVNHLRYLAYGHWVPEKEREKYKKQLQMLEKFNLIVKTPKVWYWSIKNQLSQQENDIKQLIMKQTDQLSLSETAKNKLLASSSLKNLVRNIKQIHPKQITLKIVLDQINFLASYMRDWNTQFDKYEESAKIQENAAKIKELRQDLSKKRQQFYDAAIKTKAIISQYKLFSLFYLLNSSLLIEKQLLGKISNSDKISLNFFDHANPNYQEISYAKSLTSLKTRIIFYQFFLFLFEIKCKEIGISQDSIKLLKEKFSQAIPKGYKMKNYNRFVFIRQYFDSLIQQQNQNWQSHLSKEHIVQFIKDHFQAFDHFCLQLSSNRLSQFLESGIDKDAKIFKRTMIRIFMIVAFDCISEGKQKLIVSSGSLLKIIKKNRQFSQIDPKRNAIVSQSIEMSELQRYLKSNQLLPCKYDKNSGIIQLEWTPEEFIEIAYPLFYIQKNIQLEVKSKIDKNTKVMISTQQWHAGNTGEGYIIDLLLQNQSVQFKKKNQYNNQSLFTTKQYKLNGIGVFSSLNSHLVMNKGTTLEKSTTTISKNLKDILALAKLRPNQNFIATPIKEITKNKNKKCKYRNISQCVDFLFVRYVSDENIFDITTFDTSISRSLNSKVKNAVTLLAKLLRKVPSSSNNEQINQAAKDKQDKEQRSAEKQQQYPMTKELDEHDMNNYRIQHVILCLQSFCQPPKIIADNLLSVSFFSMESATFPHIKDKQLLLKYQESIAVIKAAFQ